MDYTEKLSGFFTPDLLHQKLITASVFIAVYENFKSTIVDNVKYFYCNGFMDGKELLEDYESKVLSKIRSNKNKQIRATLLWYQENGAITEKDIEKFKQMTDLRNTLSHDLLTKMLDGLPDSIYDVYFDMINLFEQITKWWIREIEIPTNPDISMEQYNDIDWDAITSVNLEFIKIMTDIAFTGNEKYLELLRQTKKEI